MGNNAERARRFIDEFGDDYVEIYGLHEDACFTQGLARDETHDVLRLFASIKTKAGRREIVVDDAPSLPLDHPNYVSWLVAYLRLSMEDAERRLYDCGLRSPRRYWKTVYTVTVLTEGDAPPDYGNVHELADDITTGDASGAYEREAVEVTGDEMRTLLTAQGSDPGFLVDDAD